MRDDVMKMRSEQFSAALRMERARVAVEQMGKLLDGAKKEYSEAGDALRAIRMQAEATEASAVAELAKVRMPMEADAAASAVAAPADFDKARES